MIALRSGIFSASVGMAATLIVGRIMQVHAQPIETLLFSWCDDLDRIPTPDGDSTCKPKLVEGRFLSDELARAVSRGHVGTGDTLPTQAKQGDLFLFRGDLWLYSGGWKRLYRGAMR